MATELKSEIKDGISQSERYLPSLSTNYFGIDEKDTGDLLKLLCDLSGQFNYYNYSNKIQGDWKSFLTSDIDILIALLSRVDNRSMSNQYKLLTDQLKTAENTAELTRGVKNIFQFILDFGLLQIGYREQFKTASNLGHVYQADLSEEIFNYLFKKLYDYNHSAVELLGKDAEISFDHEALSFIHKGDFETIAEPFHSDGTIRNKVILSIEYFDRLVGSLDTEYAKLLNTSRQYLKDQSSGGDIYDPHVALLISFLHLYAYLQKPVNRLLEKHLDYFYRDIIGMENREESPDQLHIIVEPAPGINSFLLNKGEEIIAEIEGYQDKLVYALDSTVQISETQIKEIKTVFISNKLQLKGRKGNAGNINELQVYKGNYPAPSPEAFQKDQISSPWPLLGEDQGILPRQQKTMEEANMGLVIASPLFYQQDGHRHFSLRFFIAHQSFARFEEHAEMMSLSSELNKEILMQKMLNQAFNITVTGATGWIDIKRYAVSYPKLEPGITSGHYIDVEFDMDSKTAATAVYNNDIHGFDLNLKWPVVRLLLNNWAFHHPYTFLSYFIIERIAVKIEVKGSKRFQLKNGLGDIYAAAPFQPFGAIPAKRSYLDIKNTTIFNRYTTDFSLRIHWFDLPADEDGFAGYYAGYNVPFANRSFKVKLSSDEVLQESEAQQEFNLFEYTTAYDKEFLKETTVIEGVDLRRIRFENEPDLGAEEPENTFRKGTLRMELSGPNDAFGHRLYTQAFIDTAEHNSRKFVKKRAVPNPPYVPVIKQLSIDYTLEHSELTSGSAEGEEEEIIMVHLYPFGHDQFYSGKNSNDNYFVPPPRHESNLFLGVDKLVPGQELSLLFQLSEENFHHSVHQPELINWSHLVKNTWVPFPPSGVLLDTTRNFMSTGIVMLKIPDGVEKDNTILNPGLYWIRASLPAESTLKSKTIAIFTQAVMAVRKCGQTVFPDYTYVSPPGTVKGFRNSFPAVKGVKQFFSSVGGHPKETGRQYNTRVSERLRHKNRLLSILDISQAVLDTFPQILMVKCYNTDENAHMIFPGVDINLIVIPKEREDGSFISQEPKVSLSVLYNIKEFLRRSVSDFIRVEVGNPVYERIMVVAKVKFKAPDLQEKESDGYYLKLINQDIKRYISAWLYDPKSDFKMGAELYVLEVFNYLQHLPYVDYITGFSLVHFFKLWNREEEKFHAQVTDTSVDQRESLKGSVPGAILISAAEHQFKVISETKNLDPVRSGIGDFLIGSDLLILDPPEKKKKKNLSAPAEDLYDFTVYND